MWYKEWRHARPKILVAVFAYFLVGTYCFFSWFASFYYETLFEKWLTPSLIVTVMVATLAGVDVVAEEKDRGTLSFLLTRPLKRTRIYAIKILVNLGWLSVVYGVATAVMIGLARVHLARYYAYYDHGHFLTPPNVVRVGFGYSYSWSLGWSLAAALVVLMLGIGTVCYTAFVSIFARSVIQAIVISALIVLTLVVAVGILNAWISSLQCLGGLVSRRAGYSVVACYYYWLCSFTKAA